MTLRWKSEYLGLAFIEIAPEFQEHYLHELTLDHAGKTVTDKYWNFTGTDNSQMSSSEVTRDGTVYGKLKELIEVKELLCSYQGEDCTGPALPWIKFKRSGGGESGGYFKDQNNCGGSGTRLRVCSATLVEYLLSLRATRSE